MSSAHNLSDIRYVGNQHHGNDTIAIVVSKWNSEITNALYEGALSTLLAAGVAQENILKFEVPGAFELPYGAQVVLGGTLTEELDGLICLGCVIQGETPHFDFICQACATGIMQVSLEFDVPVIFGVLTTLDQAQAQARAGGALGNKGQEAAVAVLEMIDLRNQNQ